MAEKKITIQYLEDSNGNQQVVDLIRQIAHRALVDDDYKNLSVRIGRVLTLLKAVGVPEINDRCLKTTGHQNQEITLVDVVKELRDHSPLLESRANWIPVGAFRAIFFYEKDRNGDQYIYFTQAVIKQKTYSRDFEDAIERSERMMYDFYQRKRGLRGRSGI